MKIVFLILALVVYLISYAIDKSKKMMARAQYVNSDADGVYGKDDEASSDYEEENISSHERYVYGTENEPYFTYETIPSDDQIVTPSQEPLYASTIFDEEVADDENVSVESTPAFGEFDLRSAVIYQTIMTNENIGK